jgi:hypothetical protein
LDLLCHPSFKITFDYKEANSSPSLEFITLRHVLIKAIIDFYQNQELKTITKVTFIDSESSISKDYLFFIYLLEISGFTKSLTFVPVVVDLETNKINSKYSENLLQILKDSDDYSGGVELSSRDFQSCEESALNYMVAKKRQQELELRENNEALVNDRLDGLKQTFDIKIENIDKIIYKLSVNTDAKSMKILRMRESQKINITNNYERKKRIIESNKKIIVSHELICGGYLNVRC